MFRLISVRSLAFLIKRPVFNAATPLSYQDVVNHSGVESGFCGFIKCRLSLCHPILSAITLSGVPNLWITLNYKPNLTPLHSILNCRPLCYNLQSQRGQDQSSKSSGSKAGPNTESVQDPVQDITTSIKTGNKQMKLVSEKSLGLDQGILHSINCCRKWSTLLKDEFCCSSAVKCATSMR